ncbi:NAD-dependent epimerase/dehydratase family protein [Micromonospora lupini]|uniref:Putative dihydrokaempferol 4-reductase (NAD-dependent epimerase/dehydratase) n=1 Tax=Micromonospora lupini str. Lupac 08 TaxID=1150864 RepID=I0L7Z2_9ACTN|nr:NAD-dependent epimerase/dehydratase family protein [Micromonospora lupini]CCH19939.1 Putative dihydrokaempferol 4-reductase (NAD-dependent epimerase/dehydratase) [Micromonospora lupini str. Lupac 08]
MSNDVQLPATDDALVLVTGATGHVGGYSVARLLDEGYRVRVTVRAPGQQDEVLDRVRRTGTNPDGRVEFRTAALSADEGWAEAAEGARYVLHHASPFPFTPPANDDEVIRPARDGALRVLRAAREAGVRRVVLTSSYAAVGYTVKADGRYSEADWTNVDDDIPAYHRSKTLAERAAWDYVRDNGGVELSVVNPTGIFGPLLGARMSASTGLVQAFLRGSMPVVPRMYFGVVDVRDVVDLHLRAMLHPAAAGERFIGVGGPSISFLDLAKMLARHLPSLADRVPARELTDEEVREAAKTEPALRDAAALRGQVPVISNDKARDVLGWRPRPVETTITDTADSLIKLGLITA